MPDTAFAGQGRLGLGFGVITATSAQECGIVNAPLNKRCVTGGVQDLRNTGRLHPCEHLSCFLTPLRCGCFPARCSSKLAYMGSTTDPCHARHASGRCGQDGLRAAEGGRALRPQPTCACGKIRGGIEQVCTPSCPHPMSRLSTSIGRAHVMPTHTHAAHVMPTSESRSATIRACGLAAWSNSRNLRRLSAFPPQAAGEGGSYVLTFYFSVVQCPHRWITWPDAREQWTLRPARGLGGLLAWVLAVRKRCPVLIS